MTFDYKIIPVRDKTVTSSYKTKGFTAKKKTVSRKFKRDRRKKQRDRRASIRDGVIVNLSFQYNQRRGTDRRKRQISSFV